MPTVIDVKNGSFEGSVTLDTSEGSSRQTKRGRQTYIVLSDNLSQDGETIRQTSPLPQIGTTVNGQTVCGHHPREVSRVNHPVTNVPAILWEVDVDTDSSVKPSSDTIPEVDWEGDMEKMLHERDVMTGVRIMTTAGEPIFQEMEVVEPILVISRREAYPFSPNTQLLYAGRVNRTTFWGVPPGSALMLPIRSKEDWNNNVKVCNVEYRIKFRILVDWLGNFQPNAWQSRPLNNGQLVRPTKGKKAIIHLDRQGNPAKVNLDVDGTKLQDKNGFTLSLLKYEAPLTFGGPVGVGYVTTDPGSLQPAPEHVGSILNIESSIVGWTLGDYPIVGYTVFGGLPCWILNPSPTTVIGAGNNVWTLMRCPLYLYFNKHIPAEFNALNLGPF